MAEFEITTRVGRVVYRRKTHYYKASDIVRIWNALKKNLPPKNEIKQSDKLLYTLLATDILDTVSDKYQVTGTPPETPEEKASLENFIQNLSITMLTEIVGLIPGFPNKWETEIAEFLYWKVYYFLKDLID